MASNINPIAIDETYPVAGRDNDSQGFRDNFAIIKNNFTEAKSEIDDLQLNTARLDDSNNFNGENLLNFNMTNYTEELYDGGLVSATTLIEWTNGPFQIFQVNNNVQFTFFGWPNFTKLAKVRLQIRGDGTTRTISFATTESSAIKKSSRVPTVITITSDVNPIVIDFWSYDGGQTYFMDYLGLFS